MRRSFEFQTRAVLHKAHICHCLDQIAAGFEDGGGALAHLVIPAAVLCLASLGGGSSLGAGGSSGSEGKLRDALIALILQLQDSLTRSEVTYNLSP